MKTVLLLGFERGLSEKLRLWLEAGGYEGVAVASLEEAMACCQQSAAEVFFVNVTEPAINGFKLLTVLEENVSVVFYAESPDASEIIKSFQCGVLDFVTGSELNQDRLLRAFSKAFTKAEARQKLKVLEEENCSLRNRLGILSADQEAGRLAQLKLFPETPFYFKQYGFSHHIIPSLVLSGDFIDYFEINEEECGFYLADVSGHGASSAFVTVLLKCLVNDINKNEPQDEGGGACSPASVLQHLNRELVQMPFSKHVAMLYGVINRKKGTLVYSVAAHYPLPLFSDGKQARFLGAAALPLGVLPTLEVKEYTEPLPESFSLLMFTDGIMDVMPQESLLEKEQGLLEMFATGNINLSAVIKKLALDGIESPNDDIGILVIEGNKEDANG